MTIRFYLEQKGMMKMYGIVHEDSELEPISKTGKTLGLFDLADI